MKKYIDLYRELKISKSELQQAIGEDLHNVKCKKASRIKRSDVVNAIQLLLNGTIDKDTLVEWVNVIWFTELFVFDDKDADSIVSVLEVLETMDEDGVTDQDGNKYYWTWTAPDDASGKVRDPYDLYSWDPGTNSYIPFQAAESDCSPIGRGNGWYYYDEDSGEYVPW